jgi:hypothetical protein
MEEVVHIWVVYGLADSVIQAGVTLTRQALVPVVRQGVSSAANDPSG